MPDCETPDCEGMISWVRKRYHLSVVPSAAIETCRYLADTAWEAPTASDALLCHGGPRRCAPRQHPKTLVTLIAFDLPHLSCLSSRRSHFPSRSGADLRTQIGRQYRAPNTVAHQWRGTRADAAGVQPCLDLGGATLAGVARCINVAPRTCPTSTSIPT